MTYLTAGIIWQQNTEGNAYMFFCLPFETGFLPSFHTSIETQDD